MFNKGEVTMDSIAYQQFSTIVPFLFILFLGFLCGKSKLIESGASKTVCVVTMNLLTPFMIIDYLQIDKTSQNSSDLIWAILASAVIFALYYIVAFLFYLRKKNEISNIYACSLCSSAVSILSFPLLSNIIGINASVYSAVFILVNQLLFNILTGKVLYKNRNLIKCIINFPFIIGILAVALYFLNVDLILPIANTVSCVSDMVPALSALLIGMYFSSFPVSGLKFQFNILVVSAFKLLLFPILTFGICLIFHFSLETTLMYVILSGLPCGINLPCITSCAQNKNTSYAANITACTFVFSVATIPMMCYIAREIYSMLNY